MGKRLVLYAAKFSIQQETEFAAAETVLMREVLKKQGRESEKNPKKGRRKMANGICDKFCKGCIYSNLAAGEDILCCVYYLKTNIRRPCPAGSGCTVKETGRKKGAWQHQNDAEWAKKMQEAWKAKAVLRTAVCPECCTEFETIYTHQVFCSKRCNRHSAQRAWRRRKADEEQAKSAVSEV